MATVHQMRLDAVPEKNYRIIRIGGMDKTRVEPANFSIHDLRQRGAEFLITSGQVTWIFDTARAQEIYPEQVKFYRQVANDLFLIKEFLPNPLNVPGPGIKIYQLN